MGKQTSPEAQGAEMTNTNCTLTEDILGIKVTLEEILQVINNIGKVNPNDLRNSPLFVHMGQPEIITAEAAKEYAIRHLNLLLGNN
jgi:hypothetical protein